MATCTFTYGSTSITIAAPKRPEAEGYVRPQIVGRTMGGGRKVADMSSGTDWRQGIPLNFVALERADWDALRDFIRNTADWSSNLFTYTDPRAVALTNMFYISGIPEARAVGAGDRWNCTLVISKDEAAA